MYFYIYLGKNTIALFWHTLVLWYMLKFCLATVRAMCFSVRRLCLRTFLFWGFSMNKEDYKLNERIAVYRRLAGYSQAEAAEKLGMSKSSYAKKEKDGNIDCRLLVKISKLFCVDIGDLLIVKNEEIPFDSELKAKPLRLTFHDEQLIRIIHSLAPENQLKIKKFVYRLYCDSKNNNN